MLEPSENDIKKEKQSELDAIANANAKCVAGYQIIRQHIFDNLEKAEIEAMNKYITVEYGKIYGGLKQLIIDGLNEAKIKNVEVVEKLLDLNLRKPKLYKTLPKTPAFKYTNAVFTKKSVSVRSKKAADAITKIISDGRANGLPLVDIQKKIDVVMGFRDAQGRITDKSKKLIELGKFTHRNGSIYETYRIARTEVMRMNAFAKYDQFEELRKRYPNARLKLIATIDGRERTQSREMNGQISNAKGEFLYPDSKYYRLGTAPAKWSINDRETCTIVFLTDKEAKENREELREAQNTLNEINETQNTNNITEEILNKPYQDISNNEKIIAEMHKQVEDLTEAEQKALKTYCKGGEGQFRAINGTLRGDLSTYEEMLGSKVSPELQQKINGWIENIDNAMAKSSIPQNTQLFRGGIDNALGDIFKNEKLQEFVLNNPVNEDNLKQIIEMVKHETFTEKAFMSTSYAKLASFPGKVKLKINAPENLKGLMLDTKEIGIEHEMEVLLNRGYTWRVKNVYIETDFINREEQYIFDCYFVK